MTPVRNLQTLTGGTLRPAFWSAPRTSSTASGPCSTPTAICQSRETGTPWRSPQVWRERLPLSLGGVAASGTLPEVRQAEQIAGRYYWDGLYSLNPPIREFWEGVGKQYVPAEI
jgi:hypothetical protein